MKQYSKLTYAILLALSLSACGGEGSDSSTPEKPAPIPEKPAPGPEKPAPGPEKPTPEPEKPTPEPEKPAPELTNITVSKTGTLKVGESLEATSTCNKCVESSTQYQWIIDINDDGVFDDQDTKNAGSSLLLVEDYLEHQIQLSATVANDAGFIATSNKVEFYFSATLPVISHLSKTGDMLPGNILAAAATCTNCDESTVQYAWHIDENKDGEYTASELIGNEPTLAYIDSYRGLPLQLSATVKDTKGGESEEAYTQYVRQEVVDIVPPQRNTSGFTTGTEFYLPDTTNQSFMDEGLRMMVLKYIDGSYVTSDGQMMTEFGYSKTLKYVSGYSEYGSRSISPGILAWNDNAVSLYPNKALSDSLVVKMNNDLSVLEPKEIKRAIPCRTGYMIETIESKVKLIGLYATKKNPSGEKPAKMFVSRYNSCGYIDTDGWWTQVTDEELYDGTDLFQTLPVLDIEPAELGDPNSGGIAVLGPQTYQVLSNTFVDEKIETIESPIKDIYTFLSTGFILLENGNLISVDFSNDSNPKQFISDIKAIIKTRIVNEGESKVQYFIDENNSVVSASIHPENTILIDDVPGINVDDSVYFLANTSGLFNVDQTGQVIKSSSTGYDIVSMDFNPESAYHPPYYSNDIFGVLDKDTNIYHYYNDGASLSLENIVDVYANTLINIFGDVLKTDGAVLLKSKDVVRKTNIAEADLSTTALN